MCSFRVKFMHTEELMGETTVMVTVLFLWWCVVHFYGAEWAALVQIRKCMDVLFITRNMRSEWALRWSGCEWPWQTRVTGDDKKCLNNLWGILLYLSRKGVDVLQFSVSLSCVLMVRHWHWDSTKPSNVDKCVCVCSNCVSLFFPLGFFSWSLFFILHHTQQTNMLQYDFTHINLSSTHNYHIVHPKPTAEMLIKWEGCTWWFQTSWISNEKTRNSTE